VIIQEGCCKNKPSCSFLTGLCPCCLGSVGARKTAKRAAAVVTHETCNGPQGRWPLVYIVSCRLLRSTLRLSHSSPFLCGRFVCDGNLLAHYSARPTSLRQVRRTKRGGTAVREEPLYPNTKHTRAHLEEGGSRPWGLALGRRLGALLRYTTRHPRGLQQLSPPPFSPC